MKSQLDERIVGRRLAPRCRRVALVVIAFGLLGTGCTNRQLQSSAAKQAQTVVDLEYQQILDNLAMFSLNPEAMPSMAMLKTGATQVGDTGSIGFVGTAGLNTRFGSSPTLSGTRTIVDQWGSSPMTDDNNLLLVRKAFRCALGYKDLLKEEDANDLAHDLSAQIGTTSDISVDQDTRGRIHDEDLISDTMKRLKTLYEAEALLDNVSLFQCIEDTLQRIRVLEYEIDTAADRIAKAELEKKLEGVKFTLENYLRSLPFHEELVRLQSLSNLLVQSRESAGKYITDTLDPEILAKSYAFDIRRNISVILLSHNFQVSRKMTNLDINNVLKNEIFNG